MSQMDLFAEPDPAPPASAAGLAAPLTIDAWTKTPRSIRGAAPLPTLLRICGDDHEYAAARFVLAAGCGLGEWPSRDACVLGPAGDRMTLYDAVGARLATRTGD
ncbi:MAG: hypothetical protein ABIY70_08730 [Capsulimonas sp.]|uniref:hypothetical protein n=1 Tax=Capsulimonas sp. TaxID=2494211 RepID=UPI00326490A0